MYYLRVLYLYTRLHIIIVYNNNNTSCYIPYVCFSGKLYCNGGTKYILDRRYRLPSEEESPYWTRVEDFYFLLLFMRSLLY